MSHQEYDERDMHDNKCEWHKDWFTCNCSYNYGKYRHAPTDCVVYCEGGNFCPDCDPKGCLGVIPNTFIMCGEMGQYCSQECMEKANK